MRKTVTIRTYNKIKRFIEVNDESISCTKIRNALNVDYESVKYVVNSLINDKLIRSSGKNSFEVIK